MVEASRFGSSCHVVTTTALRRAVVRVGCDGLGGMVGKYRDLLIERWRLLLSSDHIRGLSICILGIAAFVVLNIRPIWGDYFFNCGEVGYAARLSISAQRAFAGGDFPLQFANDYDIVLRPIFLYYTPGYYGATGLIQLFLSIDPNRAMANHPYRHGGICFAWHLLCYASAGRLWGFIRLSCGDDSACRVH